MPTGLRNAPATFRALMNSIFYDYIDDFLVNYLDDLLIYGQSTEKHIMHLCKVLSRVRDNELCVGKDRWELLRDETEFLGLQVDRAGIRAGDERKSFVDDWSKPTTIPILRSFLGLLQFFTWFIQYFSSTAAPLTDLMKTHKGMYWNDKCTESLNVPKHRLVNSPNMRAPD